MSKTIFPEYSRSRVDRAGESIRVNRYVDEEVRAIENWRASHAYVLNTFQATLRNRTRGTDIVFAQRLKRRPTIYDKLKREPEMRLSRMHDIAGCRLIFGSESDLTEFRQEFHKSRFKHRLRNEDDKFNYIIRPKESGYRGVHDVYIYDVNSQSGKKWNGLSIEIQYRTLIQHAWATAVEIAGSITAHQPKFGRGADDYRQFFRYSSELLARYYEYRKSCEPELSDDELRSRIYDIERRINLMRAFEGLNFATNEFGDYPLDASRTKWHKGDKRGRQPCPSRSSPSASSSPASRMMMLA